MPEKENTASKGPHFILFTRFSRIYVAFYIYSFYVGTQNPRGSPSEVIMWIKAFSVVPGPPSILSHCFFSALQVGVVLVPYRALDET